MPRFFAPADNPADWQRLLAKPHLHWRTGYSAPSMAHSWTEAQGFPREVWEIFNDSGVSCFRDLEFLIGILEHEVPLPGGRRPSQNNVFVLAKGSDGLVSIAIEGKVSEPFDSPVDKRSSSDCCPTRPFPDYPHLERDDFAFAYRLPRLVSQRHAGNEYELLCNRSQ
jgi:hypothetical protein